MLNDNWPIVYNLPFRKTLDVTNLVVLNIAVVLVKVQPFWSFKKSTPHLFWKKNNTQTGLELSVHHFFIVLWILIWKLKERLAKSFLSTDAQKNIMTHLLLINKLGFSTQEFEKIRTNWLILSLSIYPLKNRLGHCNMSLSNTL
jgi:hypothetical protein